MKYLNRSAIVVYGTENFLRWVKESHPSLHRWGLEDLNRHPNIYLVDSEDQNCWGNCFHDNFNTIFSNEVSQYTYDGVQQPSNVTYESHGSWFISEYTESVQDLSKRQIELFNE